MLDKVKELILRPHCYKITFTYESYGDLLISCIINRPYYKSLGVYGLSGTEEMAFDRAFKRLQEVIDLEKKIGHVIESPPLDKQECIDGYYREFVLDDVEVEFKRTAKSYNITNISRKDKNGFYLTDAEIPEYYFKLKDPEFHGHSLQKYNSLLSKDEELYAWDDIRFLSGSAGLAIVKNGRVIKTKCIAMS
jgi:hypothetical protein